jgi:hypothetical protein
VKGWWVFRWWKGVSGGGWVVVSWFYLCRFCRKGGSVEVEVVVVCCRHGGILWPLELSESSSFFWFNALDSHDFVWGANPSDRSV